MNRTRKSTTSPSHRAPAYLAAAVGALSLSVALSGCGSDTASSAPPSPEAPATAAGCPSGAPAAGSPEWTVEGATGSLEVTGSTDSNPPAIQVMTPFSVKQTQVQTLRAGDGPTVGDMATVSVCYEGVNGRDGSVFDSSYRRGAPVEFSLSRVVPGFQKAIAGQHVGSTVAVAMTSADGYPDGQPAAGIRPGDTLVFAIKILDANG